MPGQNKISPKINRHFMGCCRLIKQFREELGEHDVTVKDVAGEIEQKYFTDYNIKIVVEEDVQDYENQGNQAVLEVLDKVRVDYAPLGLNIPSIAEYNGE